MWQLVNSHPRVKAEEEPIMSQWPIKAIPFFSFKTIVRQRVIRFVRWGSIMTCLSLSLPSFSQNIGIHLEQQKQYISPWSFWSRRPPIIGSAETCALFHLSFAQDFGYFYITLSSLSKYPIISHHADAIWDSNVIYCFVSLTHLKLRTV